jgi:hypothetical protein
MALLKENLPVEHSEPYLILTGVLRAVECAWTYAAGFKSSVLEVIISDCLPPRSWRQHSGHFLHPLKFHCEQVAV